MPTDPRGKCFISYRSTRNDELDLLVRVLREHGVKTWRDRDDLRGEPTRPAIEKVLHDPGTASGLLWLTPDFGGRPYLADLEVAELVTRQKADDGFFMLPVCAGGLKHPQAGHAGQSNRVRADLSSWNTATVDSDPLDLADARKVARQVLAQRLEVLDARLPAGEPLLVDVYTTKSVPRPEAALSADLSGLFADKLAVPDVWAEHVLPTLTAVVDAIDVYAHGRPVLFDGRATLPVAFALGAMLPSVRGVPASWNQYTEGAGTTPYSLADGRTASGFAVDLQHDTDGEHDLALLVSVTQDVVPAVQAMRPRPRFQAAVHADPPGKGHLFTVGAEAADLAYEVWQQARAARSRYGVLGTTHLFLAGPVGLAFMLGQLSNTWGPIQTYEHIRDDGVGRYHPAALVRPGDH